MLEKGQAVKIYDGTPAQVTGVIEAISTWEKIQGFAGGVCFSIRSPAWKNLSWIDESDVKAVEEISE